MQGQGGPRDVLRLVTGEVFRGQGRVRLFDCWPQVDCDQLRFPEANQGPSTSVPCCKKESMRSVRSSKRVSSSTLVRQRGVKASEPVFQIPLFDSGIELPGAGL